MNAVASAVQAAVSAPARFIDNGDGTVTDTALNLMWSKATLTEEEVNHEQAGKVCAELALAGHSDWRLPTIEELFALADHTKYDPAIGTEVFPDTKSDWYWSSTIHASASSCAWFVYFGYGLADSSHRGYLSAFVRAVRSLPAGQ
ncbi:Lcl C-terminal domain-containing protein [Lysobacter olei]